MCGLLRTLNESLVFGPWTQDRFCCDAARLTGSALCISSGIVLNNL